MGLIGFMGVGLCGLRSLMPLGLWLLILGACKVLFFPLAPTAMGLGGVGVEEICRCRA